MPDSGSKSKKKRVVITYGTFDLLHVGHINILRRAKALGDYLIVGVTGEDYDRERGKLNVSQSVKARVDAVKALGIVDKVIIEKHKFQKTADVQKYNVDVFVIGDDWIGKFEHLKEFCEVVYLPRTEGVSSTLLRSTTRRTIEIGIVGTGRISRRFVKESRHVSAVDIRGAFSRNIENVKAFTRELEIPFGYNNFDDLMNCGIDAVYIASPHEHHYAQAKAALLAGKHVLCEKPITLNAAELNELTELAAEKGLILLEAIKTAFLHAFTKIKSEIEKGKIGTVKEVRASFSKLIPNRADREWQARMGGLSTNWLAIRFFCRRHCWEHP